jgi:uncharacterized phosphosugar-binding protein
LLEYFVYGLISRQNEPGNTPLGVSTAIYSSFPWGDNMLIDDYAEILTSSIENIRLSQRKKILAAARIAAGALMRGGLIRVFGCGHSHILAEETFYRAGGLVPISPIFYEPLMLHESASESSVLEKREGLALTVFQRESFNKNDVLICVSTSGVNAVPVEFAKLASDAGLPVIGISSDEYLSQTPKNVLGLHLQDVCDVCVDNFAPHGDACLKPEGLETSISPVSTVTGAFIINGILAEAVGICHERGYEVPVYVSGNIPGGAEKNKRHTAEYKLRIPCL